MHLTSQKKLLTGTCCTGESTGKGEGTESVEAVGDRGSALHSISLIERIKEN